MKYVAVLLLVIRAIAQEKATDGPKPTTESLQAKVVYLEAQLAQLRLEYQYAQKVCTMPDVMTLRLATESARLQAESADLKIKSSSHAEVK